MYVFSFFCWHLVDIACHLTESWLSLYDIYAPSGSVNEVEINLSDSSSPCCAPQGSVAVPLIFLLYYTRPKFISVLGVTIIRTITSSSAIQLSWIQQQCLYHLFPTQCLRKVIILYCITSSNTPCDFKCSVRAKTQSQNIHIYEE